MRTDDEFSMTVAGRYDIDEVRVERTHLSERPEKRRAELLKLTAGLLNWLEREGISVRNGVVRG